MAPHAFIRRFRCWAVPALLCLVASLHLIRVYAFDQSAWGAGCGFGMFSKVDYHGSRIQRCIVDTNRGTYAVDLCEHFPELDFQSKVLPTDHNLNRLANAVAATRWGLPPSASPTVPTGGVTLTSRLAPTARLAPSDHDSQLLRPLGPSSPTGLTSSQDLVVYRVRVEQWRIEFWGTERLINSYLAKVTETQPNAKI